MCLEPCIRTLNLTEQNRGCARHRPPANAHSPLMEINEAERPGAKRWEPADSVQKLSSTRSNFGLGIERGNHSDIEVTGNRGLTAEQGWSPQQKSTANCHLNR